MLFQNIMGIMLLLQIMTDTFMALKVVFADLNMGQCRRAADLCLFYNPNLLGLISHQSFLQFLFVGCHMPAPWIRVVHSSVALSEAETLQNIPFSRKYLGSYCHTFFWNIISTLFFERFLIAICRLKCFSNETNYHLIGSSDKSTTESSSIINNGHLFLVKTSLFVLF